ncbi:MAG: GNAT family N-acetyltransferase [Balneolaceae bacterium]
MKMLEIVEADLSNPAHGEAILNIVKAYARDPMGLNESLPAETEDTLIDEMQKFPGTLSLIAFFDGEPAGIANCFYGFSTFNAAKLINIHDLAVNPSYRGKGIGESLLAAVEKKALEANCCKITLEVREDNRARNLYERFGFKYGGEARMFFMSKKL